MVSFPDGGLGSLHERDVWVLITLQTQELKGSSLELARQGREIADKLGVGLCALVPLTNITQLMDSAVHDGFDRVFVLETASAHNLLYESCIEILLSLIREHDPSLVLLAADSLGQTLAPRLAAGLEAGLASYCVALDAVADGLVLQTKPVYGGRAWATITSTTAAPQVATLKPGVTKAKPPERAKKAEIVTISCGSAVGRARVIDYIPADPKAVPIEEAEVLVACGRGLGRRENYHLVEELADVLGASVAASRMAVDSGWAPSQRLVGISGKTVTPRLYIACGISGAIHHTMGMKDSEEVIAINIDKNAPIFRLATIGIVGDLGEVVPAITREVRRALSSGARGVDSVVDVFGDFQ